MKRCGRLKARNCDVRYKQCSLYALEAYSSPAICTKSVLLFVLIESFEGRNVKIVDIPPVFLNSIFVDGDVVHIPPEGGTADKIVKIAPNVYRPYLHKSPNIKLILLLYLTKALYDYVKYSMLSWLHLTSILKH